MNPAWSYALTAVGVLGLWLAGRKDRRGWLVGLAAQGLWVAYAVATEQWGFLVSAAAYGWVYARNARAWRCQHSNVFGDGARADCGTSLPGPLEKP